MKKKRKEKKTAQYYSINLYFCFEISIAVKKIHSPEGPEGEGVNAPSSPPNR